MASHLLTRSTLSAAPAAEEGETGNAGGVLKSVGLTLFAAVLVVSGTFANRPAPAAPAAAGETLAARAGRAGGVRAAGGPRGAVSNLADCTFAVSDAECNAKDSPVLSGVDVVAYRDLAYSYNASAPFGSRIVAAGAVAGSADYTSTYADYTFYFSTAANRDLFAARPAYYAPAWGGFCAFGISGYDGNNYLKKESQLWSVPADVDQWSIIDDRLYLFRGEEAMELFREAEARNVAGGESEWSGWFGECTGYYNTQCFM